MLPPSPVIDRCKTGILTPLAFLAGAKLEVFTALADGPKSAATLALELDVNLERLEPLLFALAAAELLEHDAGAFSNTAETGYYLVRSEPHYIGDVHRLFEDLWRGAFLAAESVKAGRPLAAHDYAGMSDEALAAFFRGQHPDALLAGWKLADALDLSTVRDLADVGGGSGGVSIALCDRYSELRATVLELPAVANVARRSIAEAGLTDRIDAAACDLLQGPIAGSYDLIVVRALLQVLGPYDCQKVLSNLRPALAPGGRLVIVGQIVDDDRLAPATVALFNLIFLSFYEQGRVHTEGQHRGWLQKAGFGHIERRLTPNGLNLMLAAAT